MTNANKTFNRALVGVLSIMIVFGLSLHLLGDVWGMEKVSGMGVADSNNNPLNIKVTQGQVDTEFYKGLVGTDTQGHATFDTIENGYAAGIKYIQRAQTGENKNYEADMTLKQFFITYTGDNNWQNHIIFAKEQGYAEDTKIEDVDPYKLAPAIARAEDVQYFNELESQDFFEKFSSKSAACFLPTTHITLSDGSTIQIQDIEVGDKVLSYDLENKRPVVSEVQNTNSHMENEYLVVNEKIEVTPHQSMYINGEWKQIGNAEVGDYLMDKEGKEILIESIREVYDEKGVMVYDLEIADYHYYFAEGVLVHNSDDQASFPETLTFQDGEYEKLDITDLITPTDGNCLYISEDDSNIIEVDGDGNIVQVYDGQGNKVDSEDGQWTSEKPDFDPTSDPRYQPTSDPDWWYNPTTESYCSTDGSWCVDTPPEGVTPLEPTDSEEPPEDGVAPLEPTDSEETPEPEIPIGVLLDAAYEGATAGRYLSILFGMEDNSWRRAMDKFFVHTVLGSYISGNWEESFCHYYIERAPPGTMYITVPDGDNLVGIGAHIEAERSEELPFCEDDEGNDIEGPCYFYKISLYLNNPKEPSTAGAAFVQDMDFRVILSGEQTISLFLPPVIPLGPGDTFSRTGSNMIAFYSDKLYTKACIKFQHEVFTAAGESKSEVCNNFNVYQGAPTTVSTGGGGGGSGGITINPNI